MTKKLGRYRVEYPTNEIPGFENAGHYDDLEQAGRVMMETPGCNDVYDTQENRFVETIVEIDCVAKDYEKWHRNQFSWWRRVVGRFFPYLVGIYVKEPS